jgi:branched-chain amino acid transport system permease protein
METIKDAFNFRDFSRAEQIGLIILSLFLLLFPFLGAGSFVKAVMIQFMLFSLFGMGWNTIGGYGGQVELGKAQYVGIGAYTVALTMVWWKIPFWFSMPIGVLLAIGYSFMIGYPLFRLKGHYFAIATICTSLVLQDIFINWKMVGAAKGIELPIHAHPDFLYMQFKSDNYYYYFIMVLFYAALFYMNWFRKSRLGYQLRMIKDDEEGAESLGIDARWCKIKAYSIASAFVAVGGGFMAVYNLYIDPISVMDLDLSIKIALMAMLGGAASLWGPIIGAAFLVPLDRFLGSWLGGHKGLIGVDFMIYSMMIMLVSAYQPRGIWGIIEQFRQRGK